MTKYIRRCFKFLVYLKGLAVFFSIHFMEESSDVSQNLLLDSEDIDENVVVVPYPSSLESLGSSYGSLNDAEEVNDLGETVQEQQDKKRLKWKECCTGQLWKQLWNLTHNNRRYLVVGIIALVLATIADSFIPYFTGKCLDVLIHPAPHTLDHFREQLWWLGGVSLGSTLFTGIRTLMFAQLGFYIGIQTRERLFYHLLQLDISFYDNHSSGQLMSRMTNDCSRIGDQTSWQINICFRSFLQFTITVYLMFQISSFLTWICLSIVPVLVLVTNFFGIRMYRNGKDIQDTLAISTQKVQESISDIRTLRSLGGEIHMFQKYVRSMQEYRKYCYQCCLNYLGHVLIMCSLPRIVTVAVLWYGVHEIMDQRLTPGELVTFILYVSGLVNTLYIVGDVFKGIMESMGAVAKVFEILQEPFVKNGPYCPETLDTLPTDLHFYKVDFQYPHIQNDYKVLSEFSWKISPGEMIAICGESGSGKSTCISLLERWYDPNEGDIQLHGHSISQLDLNWWYQYVALVSQEPVLFMGTIAENITLGLQREVDYKEIRYYTRLAQADNFIKSFPLGYETKVGEKGRTLSGGQKQRIALARALIRKPHLLILDEATSALDAESEYQVQQAIDHLIHHRDTNMTILIIAHRLSTIQNADRIGVMRDGAIVEEGTHQELWSQKGAYHRLVKKQLIHSQE